MSEETLGSKVAGAAKWSVFTQVASKLISPITTMLLARILTPEAFGVVASATMITSLADMISDSGFQKYLIQHQYSDEEDIGLSASVAFWTNLAVSFAAVLVIFLVKDSLANMVGNPGKGLVLSVASLSLPLTSLSSVQTGLYQRRLDFKTLFTSRISSSLLILVVSVPLAVLGFDYWSMVIGTLCSSFFLAVWLTVKSPWKPGFQYSFSELWKMLSYGMWILGEAVAAWVNTWAGTFILGNLMNATYVGYYKTSTSMAQSIIGIVTAAVLPVVFSTLSKVQDDRERFERVFLKLQFYLGLCVVPIALGVLTYRELVTMVLLGPQWMETATFFGLWTGVSCLVVVLGYMCSEAYRAVGRPHYCVIVQIVYLIPFLPTLWVSASMGYSVVSWVMPLIRLFLLAINLFVMHIFLHITLFDMLSNMKWIYIAAGVAMIPGIIATSITESYVVALIAIFFSVIIYLLFLLFQPDLREAARGLMIRLGLDRFCRSHE